jgi:hypothetical protein
LCSFTEGKKEFQIYAELREVKREKPKRFLGRKGEKE